MLSLDYVNIADFGARPNKGEDSTEAVRKAIAHCRKHGIGKLVFERGRYDFKHPSFLEQYDQVMKHGAQMDLGQSSEQKAVAFRLEDMSDFEWDGGDSEFVFHGLAQPFACLRCRSLKLHRFTVDWHRPLFLQGVVGDAGDSSAIVELGKGYEVDGPVPIAALLNYDPDSEYPLTGTVDAFHCVERTEWLAPNRLKLHYSRPQGLKPGMHFVMRHLMNYRMGILFYECSQVQVHDVTLRYTPGMGIIGHRSEDLAFTRLKVAPGAGRVLSTNTDATHFISCKGEISFTECSFEGMGDDAVNVHGFYFRVRTLIDDYTIEAFVDIEPQSEMPEYPDAGDAIEFVRGDTLEPYATHVLEAVERKSNGVVLFKFRQPIPPGMNMTDLMANATRVAALTMTDCTVRNNRARAILVQTRNVRIENCLFDHCTGTAIHLNCSIHWYESLTVRQVVIRNNKFLECGGGCGTIGGAGVMTVSAEGAESVLVVHRDIQFRNNIVYGRGGLGLRIQSAEHMIVADNQFNGCSPIAELDHSRHIRFRGNRYDRNRAGIVIGEGCVDKTIELGKEQ
ncbi:right-handed parallel beta-helix repeat-containing protein [Paenibacillus chungangensis]|uniref:Right-handed parallel beta-helix repeat-containing protein n=1 Tax=Paenibacillus chungangensis TaxID=696535 RepID=A0ABW3HTU5_9BACL